MSKSAHPDHVQPAEPIQIVSSQRRGCPARSASDIQEPANPGRVHQRASLSRWYLACRKPVCPDRIHRPTRLDRFQQVESQPTQIASSQLELLTNSCCESHTRAKLHSSQIMTEKAHLPTNKHSVICHRKTVRTTINQWACFELINHVYIIDKDVKKMSSNISWPEYGEIAALLFPGLWNRSLKRSAFHNSPQIHTSWRGGCQRTSQLRLFDYCGVLIPSIYMGLRLSNSFCAEIWVILWIISGSFPQWGMSSSLLGGPNKVMFYTLSLWFVPLRLLHLVWSIRLEQIKFEEETPLAGRSLIEPLDNNSHECMLRNQKALLRVLLTLWGT